MQRIWKYPLVSITLVLYIVMHGGAHADQLCMWSNDSLSFSGSPSEQARCLLTPVKQYGHTGIPIEYLPQTLETLVGKSVLIDLSEMQHYLEYSGFSADDAGGDLQSPLSETKNGVGVKYFVIHDTSTPELPGSMFPENVNERTDVNRLARYKGKGPHLFINRLGETLLNYDFSVPRGGTKLEGYRIPRRDSKGIFLHIELVQPRQRHDPNKSYASVAPSPGFTDKQYHVLALAYVAASVRRGHWLIPAFHRIVDDDVFVKILNSNGILVTHGPHDDPQKFELDYWSDWIRYVLEEIEYANAYSRQKFSALNPMRQPSPKYSVIGDRLTCCTTKIHTLNRRRDTKQ